jgi:hypothetical protein
MFRYVAWLQPIDEFSRPLSCYLLLLHGCGKIFPNMDYSVHSLAFLPIVS